MDLTSIYDPTLPLDLDGSANPDLLTEVTFSSHLEYPDGSVPMVNKISSGRMSPVRARTMKEYDQQIGELKKENFNLKLRIYFLEERLQQKLGDGEDVFRTNIELKVDVESLKKELADKHELLKRASNAIESVVNNHQTEFTQMKNQMRLELDSTQKKLGDSEKKFADTQMEFEKLKKILNSANEELRDNMKKDNRIEELQASLLNKNRLVEELNAAIKERDVSVKTLEEENDRAIGEVKELSRDNVKKLQREINRKDRDIQHLSQVMKDSSVLDGSSFLVNNHLQDVIDDQEDKIKKLEGHVDELRAANKDNIDVIQKLKDMLRSMDKDKKEIENQLKQSEEMISKQKRNSLKRDNAIIGLTKALKDKAKEIEGMSSQIMLKETELNDIKNQLSRMTFERSQDAQKHQEELSHLDSKLTNQESELLQHQKEIENLVRSLGKKEGELENVQDLLDKAEAALQLSEEAVESLQDELKQEQVDGDASINKEMGHYKKSLEECKKRLKTKEHQLHQVQDMLHSKERQLQHCLKLLKSGNKNVSEQNGENELDKLHQALIQRDSELKDLQDHVRSSEKQQQGKLDRLMSTIQEKDNATGIKQILLEQLDELRHLNSSLSIDKSISRIMNEEPTRLHSPVAIETLRSQLQDGIQSHNLTKADMERQLAELRKISDSDASAFIGKLQIEVKLKSEMEENVKPHVEIQHCSEQTSSTRIIDPNSNVHSSPRQRPVSSFTTPDDESPHSLFPSCGSPPNISLKQRSPYDRSPRQRSPLRRSPKQKSSPSKSSQLKSPVSRSNHRSSPYIVSPEASSFTAMSSIEVRRLAVQLQEEVHKLGEENDRFKRQLNSVEIVREVPGENENDFTDKKDVQKLLQEIRALRSELLSKDSELDHLRHSVGQSDLNEDNHKSQDVSHLKKQIQKLKMKLKDAESVRRLLEQQISVDTKTDHNPTGFNPVLIVQMASEIERLKQNLSQMSSVHPSDKIRSTRDFQMQTACDNSHGATTDFQMQTDWLSSNRVHGHSSKIPRLRKTCLREYSKKVNLSDDFDSISSKPETLKRLLSDSRLHLAELEAKLLSTEGTVHYQSKKIRYYRGLLEDNALLPGCRVRSYSESSLTSPATSHPRSNLKAVSLDNLNLIIAQPRLLVVNDWYNNYGITNDVHILQNQIMDLKSQLDRYQQLLTLHHAQRQNSDSHVSSVGCLGCNKQHSIQPQLEELKEVNTKLQTDLQELEGQKVMLQTELLKVKGVKNDETNDISKLLEDSQKMNTILQSRLSSTDLDVMESEKEEIHFLRKKLCENWNTCSQFSKWLEDLSDFLSDLVHCDQNGSTDVTNLSSFKQKLDHSRAIVESISASLQVSEMESVQTSDGGNNLNIEHMELQRLRQQIIEKDALLQRKIEDIIDREEKIKYLSQQLLVSQKFLEHPSQNRRPIEMHETGNHLHLEARDKKWPMRMMETDNDSVLSSSSADGNVMVVSDFKDTVRRQNQMTDSESGLSEEPIKISPKSLEKNVGSCSRYDQVSQRGQVEHVQDKTSTDSTDSLQQYNKFAGVQDLSHIDQMQHAAVSGSTDLLHLYQSDMSHVEQLRHRTVSGNTDPSELYQSGLSQKQQMRNRTVSSNTDTSQLYQSALSHVEQLRHRTVSGSTDLSHLYQSDPSQMQNRTVSGNTDPSELYQSGLSQKEQMQNRTVSGNTGTSQLYRTDLPHVGQLRHRTLSDSTDPSQFYHSTRIQDLKNDQSSHLSMSKSNDSKLFYSGDGHHIRPADQLSDGTGPTVDSTKWESNLESDLASSSVWDDTHGLSDIDNFSLLDDVTSRSRSESPFKERSQNGSSMIEESHSSNPAVNRLKVKLGAVEDLNKTLKDEINLYESLYIFHEAGSSQNSTDLQQHLAEIRALRLRLEKSLEQSDRLQEKLLKLQPECEGSKGFETKLNLDDLYKQLQDKVDVIRAMQDIIEEKEKLINELSNLLSEKENGTIILSNNMIVEDKKTKIFEQNNIFAERKQSLTDQRLEMKQQESLVAEHNDTVQQYEVKLSRYQHEQTRYELSVRELTEKISEKQIETEEVRRNCEEKKMIIDQQNKIIQKLGKDIETQKQTAAELQQELEYRDQKILEVSENLRRHELSIREMTGKIYEQQIEMERVRRNCNEKKMIIDKQNEIIQKLEKDIESQKQTAAELQQELEYQDQKILMVQQLEREGVGINLDEKTKIIDQQNEFIQKLQKDLEIQKHTAIELQHELAYRDNKTIKVSENLRKHEMLLEQEKEHRHEWQHKVEQLTVVVQRQERKLSQHKEGQTDTGDLAQQHRQILEDKDRLKHLNQKLVAKKEKLELALKKASKEIKKLHSERTILREQVQENDDLNHTLKLELSIYEKLHVHTETKVLDKTATGSIEKELFMEIKRLRIQLERCIETNTSLRLKVEKLLAQKCLYDASSDTVSSRDRDVADGDASRPAVCVRTDKFVTSSCTPTTEESEDPVIVQEKLHSSGSSLDADVALWQQNVPEANVCYRTEDSPEVIKELLPPRIDSDIRNLFAVGKLEDFEKLQKENGECLIVLSGVEARVRDRLKSFHGLPILQDLDYSTLKEVAMSVENLRICLNEEKALIKRFWFSQLPSTFTSKGAINSKLLNNNESLQRELRRLKKKYDHLSSIVNVSQERLHTANQQKQEMESKIYRQLRKTADVWTQAKVNFEQKAFTDEVTQHVPTRTHTGDNDGST